EAREKFAQAAETLKQDQAPEAAIAAFDRACAAHRKGDTAQARDGYLEAGLARDKNLAAEAHFNLGCLSAENARALAGEQPASVPPDKRTEIVDKLKEAAMYFRHCLEIRPAHAGARRNIELVREWIKYYADRWHELDRKKRRDETNLLQFVEYLITAEGALRESVKALKPNSSLDAFAEHKRVQDELFEETGPLKEKIRAELTPPAQMPGQPGAGAQPQQPPQPDPQQVAAAVKLLQDWADAAGGKMQGAAEKLSARQPTPAAEDQKGAVTELERIWEAVVPFHALLGRDLQDQTAITHTLKPDSGEEEQKAGEGNKEKKPDDKTAAGTPPPGTAGQTGSGTQAPAQAPAPVSDEDVGELAELQEKTAHRTELLKAKADAELKQVEQMPQPPAQPNPPPGPKDPKTDDSKQPQGPAPVDPEKLKEGYRKAVELAPKAVEKMNSAAGKLRGKKTEAAYPDAEEARKILEEIAKAQPKNEQQKQQDKKDQEKKDQDKQKQDEQKKQDEKKEEEQKQEKQQEEQRQMTQDQINAVLRKVREREKEKHERDEKMKAMILGGTPGVEKDW
ncbi:MAG: hypothetical protein NTW87_36620, partial [Planctomycetota bacterium]|nr:hypothetical protein [Planctomycetota bacterium]